MKHFLTIFSVVGLALTTLSSCENEPKTGEMYLDTEYVWAMSGANFELNQVLYHPMSGDTLTFDTFKQYLSNIKLHNVDGSTWAVEESYHLLDASDSATLSIHFTGVPVGEYDGMDITFGVDSARNVSGVQTGALDPANEMFWTWNSGYIMVKAEGTSPQSASNIFKYHLGGFTGENKVVTTRTFAFPNSEVINLDGSTQPHVILKMNPAKLFHTYGSVSNGEIIMAPSEGAGIMSGDFFGGAFLSEVLY